MDTNNHQGDAAEHRPVTVTTTTGTTGMAGIGPRSLVMAGEGPHPSVMAGEQPVLTEAAATPKAAWQDIGLLDEIPRQGTRTVATPNGTVAVFRTRDDHVFALSDHCPHKGGKLSHGIVHGHAVTCPLHNWVISLTDGQAAEPDEGCVRRFAVRLDGRRILLGTPA
jgi:nitrite reductase (NADH) small subunit